MKWKYFLRGLGAGILIATLVLCVAYRKGNQDSLSVVQQAKKLGMVFPEGTQPPADDIIEATKQPEQSEEPAVTEEPKETTAEKPESKEKTSETKEPAKTKKPAETEKPKTTKASQKKTKKKSSDQAETIRFHLRDASSSISAARQLEDAGLISSAAKFDSYMQDHGYSPKVRAGDYRIPKDASYEQIAKIITHQS